MLLETLFEDEFILIVNKPNNVLVHNSYYARNIKDATLLDILKENFKAEFFPVHRLDRKTSGIILLCKNKEHISIFQDLFNSKAISKNYIALVRGFFTDSKIITSPVKNPENGLYKNAETHCKLLQNIELPIPVEPYATARYSLINLIPITGRTHQLRIHMNKVNHPIIGDHKYGNRHHNRMFVQNFDCANLFLHSYLMEFTHPITTQQISVTASLPPDWTKIMREFNWTL